jgi:hypothetical protein
MKKNILKIITIVNLVLFLVGAAGLVNADAIKLKELLKETPSGDETTNYIAWTYYFMVSLTIIASLGSLIWGGILWMGAESITSTENAKEWITAAISGLVLALCSWLILYTINPQLLNLNGPIVNWPAKPSSGTGTGGEIGGGYTSPGSWQQGSSCSEIADKSNEMLGFNGCACESGSCSGTQPTGYVCCKCWGSCN